MGDPTGYGLHGDFISGWNTTALQYVIDNCMSASATTLAPDMSQCSGIPGGAATPSATCLVPNPINEQVTGTLNKLPGCNPVQVS
ncbi:hypothetical protein LTR86_010687 [Recurvomyces mirabilis]|nr:hypothetical protein LTR86_010687 [Recurvomyces mirabilis]